MGFKCLLLILVVNVLPVVFLAQADGSSITAEELKGHVFFLASDEMKGRGTGTDEYKRVAEYAATQFRAAGLKTVFKDEEGNAVFLQPFKFMVRKQVYQKYYAKEGEEVDGDVEFSSFNVVGIVEGTDPVLRDEYIVVGAHLDHLGIRGGKIHNGANDNASGSAAVIEIAEEIAIHPPKRSVVFALWGAEEMGLHGSKYFVANSPVDLGKYVVNLNIDGIGRYNNQVNDEIKLQALGADAICANLQSKMEEVNSGFGKLTLDQNDSNRYFFTSSDQVAFHDRGIPAIMFTDLGSGVYHSPADDAEAIEYDKLREVSVYISGLTGRIAGLDSRVCK